MRLISDVRSVRTVVVAALAALAVLVPATTPQAAAGFADDVDTVVVASGLSLAVDLAAPPGDDRLFVVEKVGRIRIVENGTVLATPFLDITGPVRSSGNEQGLLGLAFPADYAESGLFYVHYTADAGSGDTTIAEYSVSANPDVADASSGRILFTTDQPNTNHNGGGIHIGPDGYLYASIGDGGGGGDPGENGQNKNTTLGTIIRLDPATGDAAPGNPFVGGSGADEIWAYGLRNPWRFSFDAATGDMFIGDVGQGFREEVDVAPAGVGGLNFGWNTYEGSSCFDPPCSPDGMTFPVHEYSHRSGGACGGSITGGYVYRGNAIPWLRGHYFYADWCHGDLKSFRLNAAGEAVQHVNWAARIGAPSFITAFGQDGFGELYFLAQGKVYKLVSTRQPNCDFNGDGSGDVATGSPGEKISGAAESGRVVVVYGRNGPIDPTDNQVIHPGEGGLPGAPGAGDHFGYAVACGDFDRDGYSDLAVGAPGDGGGAVYAVYGGPNGLGGAGSDRWTQNNLGLGPAGGGDEFGFALAAGDLNRDGYIDLVSGAPGDAAAGPSRSGSVAVVFGGSGGLTASGATQLHQDAPKTKGVAEGQDEFGYSLAVGDVDGDGYGDVLAGIPGERIAGAADAGALAVFFGKPLGIGPRDQLVHRNTPGINGAATAGDRFGTAVVSGIFDLDGFDDIAVGMERADGSGAVQAIYGGAAGLSKRDLIYRQGAGGINGLREAGDRFGTVLATGDSNGDGFDELAVAAPGENHNGKADAGLVGVIPGSAGGLDAAGYQVWHQDVAGMKGVAQPDDAFGQGLAFVDVRGDGRLDLLIGAPGGPRGGEVSMLPGRFAGISVVGDKRWDQTTPGIPGSGTVGDLFGWAL